jgi:peptidoglycan/LPS O-acetylase OafA/YrhL
MLNSLQACRALAAVLIVLHHANHSIFGLDKYFGHKPLGCWVDFAFAGVDFFYVLCGFIMFHVHADDFGQPRALVSYLWKRFSRIYPVYWIVLVSLIPVYFLAPQFGIGHERDPLVIVRSFVLFPFPATDFPMVVAVAWTLVYEILFYLLFGLLILNKRFGTIVFAVWTVGILASGWFESYPWSFVFSHHHLRFLAGMGVGMLLRHRQVPAPRVVASAGILLFLGSGLVEDFYGPMPTAMQTICFGLASAGMILGLAEAERSGLIRVPRLLAYLGDASYSIYLVHFPALSLIAKLSKAIALDQYLPGAILFVLHIFGSVGIGCLCHQLIENPIQAWAKRCFRRAKSLASAPPVCADSTRKAA